MKFRENQRIPKTYFLWKWQNKADAFEKALKDAKWYPNTIPRTTAAAFFDMDILERVDIFNRLHGQGVKLFLYPHQARPNIVYAWKDQEPHPHTSASFVSAHGHVEVMRILGYPHGLHVVGWSYCQLLPFQPARDIRRVLWGPLHPNGNGWLSDGDKAINQRAFKRLLAAKEEMGFDLHVRFIHQLEENGLTQLDIPGITYERGKPDNSFRDIDEADVVVGTQTFAYIAIARGKPTLMMDEWVAPRGGNTEQMFAYIRNWDDIKHLMMYPHDINTSSDVAGLIRHVATTDYEILDWKKRMIGEQFNPKAFVSALESYF